MGRSAGHDSTPGHTWDYGVRSMGIVAEYRYAHAGSVPLELEDARLGDAITKEGGLDGVRGAIECC